MKNIKDYLKVDPTSPSGLRWIKKASPRAMPGSIAGRRDSDGYWRVGFNRKQYSAHRLVLLLSGIKQPSQKHQADHIDGSRSNNKIDNLRWVTRSRSSHNKERACATGFRWVKKNPKSFGFQYGWAGLARSGFSTAEEAHAAALAKRKELGLPIDTRLSTVH